MENSHNVTAALIKNSNRTPGASALVLPNREITYRELDLAVWGGAAYLKAAGIERGHIIATTFQNQLAFAFALLAAARLGATVLPIPISATPTQRAEWIRIANADFFLSDNPKKFSTPIKSLVFTINKKRETWPSPNELIDPNPEVPFIIMVGSGSTGRPKLMPLLHWQSAERGKQRHQDLIPRQSDRHLVMSGLDFSGGINRLIEMINSGGAYVFPGAGIDRLIEHCLEKKVTMLSSSVFHIERLLGTLPENTKNSLFQLRSLQITGSTVTQDLRLRISSKLTRSFYIQYGTNEIGTLTTLVNSATTEISASVGFLKPGLELQIVDQNDKPLEHGEAGLIRARSPAQISGYLNDDEATNTAFRNGWFYPGDAGRFEPDGQLIFLGRADHMMIYNGINIYPAEIESCLAGHPAVSDTAAFPFRHSIHQDIPVCAVTLKRGYDESEASILNYAKEMMGFRAPRRLFLVDAIPRNIQGKLIRAEMFDLINKKIKS